MTIIRLILSPLSLLYQLVLRIRNYLYDSGLFGVTYFDIPTINVGNLAFGGTGKTPHIEYLVRLLKDQFAIAVLSRGYKRKTTGYVFADSQSSANTIGDEPMQIYTKFKPLPVAVAENRVLGLPDLLYDAPETQVVLLDDAFQHRAIKPGINILLTEYNNRFTQDFLAPAGMLREYRAAYVRADIIIVSKCNPDLSLAEREQIRKEIKPYPHQQVYFSFIKFGALEGLYEPITRQKPGEALVFAGIANPQSLVDEIEKRAEKVQLKKYPDHYNYIWKDIEDIVYLFEQMTGSDKIIITTEKDRTKLMAPEIKEVLEKHPIFYLPVEVVFFNEDQESFNNQIIDYVAKNSANH
ncbi:MAG: tetraacyldisaccharide 4'-kinase [Bacteroidota bacterium]|nr:tetraacyldisaccharide 4'-kinase [Bacteroidota bacterium]